MAAKWDKGPSERLAQLLEDKDITAASIGRGVGLKRSTITNYLSGKRTPNADTLASILELCGGSADEVLGLRPPTVDRAKLQRAAGLVAEVLDATADQPGTRKREP